MIPGVRYAKVNWELFHGYVQESDSMQSSGNSFTKDILESDSMLSSGNLYQGHLESDSMLSSGNLYQGQSGVISLIMLTSGRQIILAVYIFVPDDIELLQGYISFFKDICRLHTWNQV